MDSNLAWNLTDDEISQVGLEPKPFDGDLTPFMDCNRRFSYPYQYGGHCDLLEIASRGDRRAFESLLKEYRAFMSRCESKLKASNDDYVHVDVYGDEADKIIVEAINLVQEGVTTKSRIALTESAFSFGLSDKEAKAFAVQASKLTGSKRFKKVVKVSSVSDSNVDMLVINSSTSVSSIINQLRKLNEHKNSLPELDKRTKSEITRDNVQQEKANGLKQKQVVELLGVSLTTVKRHWN